MCEVKGSDASAMSTMGLAYSVSCIDNEGNFVDQQCQLYKRCAHDICIFYYNCNYSFWKKKGELLSYHPPYHSHTPSVFFVQIPIQIREQTVNIHFIHFNYCFIYIFGMNVTVSSLLSKAYHSALNINMCCCYITT